MSVTTSKRWKAAIVGGSGYGGAELARRLIAHPDVELGGGQAQAGHARGPDRHVALPRVLQDDDARGGLDPR